MVFVAVSKRRLLMGVPRSEVPGCFPVHAAKFSCQTISQQNRFQRAGNAHPDAAFQYAIAADDQGPDPDCPSAVIWAITVAACLGVGSFW